MSFVPALSTIDNVHDVQWRKVNRKCTYAYFIVRCFSADYKDQNVRKEAWKVIGDVLQMPGKYILYYYIIFPTMHIVARWQQYVHLKIK